MAKRFVTFLSDLAIKVRYAAADTADEHERGSFNAIATVLEMLSGYRKLPSLAARWPGERPWILETVLRQVAAILDRAWWKSASADNRELLTQVGYACRHFAEEIAKAKVAEAPKPEPVYADEKKHRPRNLNRPGASAPGLSAANTTWSHAKFARRSRYRRQIYNQR